MIISQHQQRFIDLHVKEGLDLATIKRVTMVKNPSSYIIRSGKQEEYTKAQEIARMSGDGAHRKRLRRIQKEHVDMLVETIYSQAKEEGKWFYWRAIEFQAEYNNRKHGEKISFGELLPIIWEAEDAVTLQYRVSAKALSHQLHMHERIVSAILKYIDAPRSTQLRASDEERIILAYRAKVPQALIRHLYDLTQQKATMLAKKIGLPMPKREILWYCGGHEKDKLDFVKASKVYEQRDKGECIINICTKLGMNEDVYNYALGHRYEIEPRILDAMNILFPDREVYTPYYLSPFARRPSINELVYRELCISLLIL